MRAISSSGMASPKRVTVSVKLSAETAARLRAYVRDNRGKPWFWEMGTFVEEAIIAHLTKYETGESEDNNLNCNRATLNSITLQNDRHTTTSKERARPCI